jgi:uncharacterized membrane protein
MWRDIFLRLFVFGVVLSAMLGSLGLMMHRLKVMAMRDVSVMVPLSVIACLVSFGCFVMVRGRLLVMVASLGVVVGKFLARHSSVLPFARRIGRSRTIGLIFDRRMKGSAPETLGRISVRHYAPQLPSFS